MKHLLKIAGYIIGFVVSSIIILAFLIDANMFKPRITALAQEHGIALDMRGDLHWAFWPSIGLAVHDMSIASTETPTSPIAEIQKASFLIAFIPLMQGNFQVKHILVDGAAINLEVNTQGKGNWEALTKSQEAHNDNEKPRVKVDSSVNSNDLHLAIEKISLQHNAISYIDHNKNKSIHLSDIQLEVAGANTTNEPFDLDFSWLAQISDADTKGKKPFTIKGKLHNRIALNSDISILSLSDGNLKLDLDAASSTSMAIKYSLKIEQLSSAMNYQGTISLADINAKKLLATFGNNLKTANEKALTDVSLAAEINGNMHQIFAKSVTLQLDKSSLKGEFAVTDFATQAITANLQGDEINADDYLAPTSKPEAKNEATANKNNEEPLPLAILRKLNVDLKIMFNKMIFSQLSFEKAQLDIAAKNGIIQQQLSSDAYSGSIHEKATINVGETAAKIQFESILHGIQLAPILKDKKLDKSVNLSGAIEANASGQTNGSTMAQFINSLTATLNFSGAQMRLAPINIEQQFCHIIDLVNKNDAGQKTWNEYTELRELSGKVTIANRVITVDAVNAGIQKLQLSTKGTINLANGSYDFILPLKLIRDANDTATSIITSAQGCTVNSNYWTERSMSLLRCKGTYADINPVKDCRPDKDMLTAVIKDFAEYKIREKHGEKIDAKKAELIKKLDDKLGGEGQAEKAKTLLKNLFKKNTDQKDNQ